MKLVSEPIIPLAGSADLATMGRGEPGLPAGFTWRGQDYAVEEVLETWKQAGLGRGATTEKYLRKHWFKFRSGGQILTVYCDRLPRDPRHPERRWTLYGIG